MKLLRRVSAMAASIRASACFGVRFSSSRRSVAPSPRRRHARGPRRRRPLPAWAMRSIASASRRLSDRSSSLGVGGKPVDLAASVSEDGFRFSRRVTLLALVGGQQRLRLLGKAGGFVDAAADAFGALVESDDDQPDRARSRSGRGRSQADGDPELGGGVERLRVRCLMAGGLLRRRAAEPRPISFASEDAIDGRGHGPRHRPWPIRRSIAARDVTATSRRPAIAASRAGRCAASAALI